MEGAEEEEGEEEAEEEEEEGEEEAEEEEEEAEVGWSMERSIMTARASHGRRPSLLKPRWGGSVRELPCDSQLQQLKKTANGRHLQLLQGDAGDHVVKKRAAAAARPR